MKSLKKMFFGIKGFLFPSVCPLCGCSLMESMEIMYGICEKCLLTLIPEEENKCNFCGRPLVSEKEFCLSCRREKEMSIDRFWVIFPYTGRYRNLLSAYKFNKNLTLAEYFAEQVLTIILNTEELKNACIVPVPPRPGKIKENGWDQVDYLVKCIKKKAKKRINISYCLKRKKSKTQKSLDRQERLENLKGRIYIRQRLWSLAKCLEKILWKLSMSCKLSQGVPKTALVIDDVITTGSTMEVCASVLKTAGVGKVYGLCLFYD